MFVVSFTNSFTGAREFSGVFETKRKALNHAKWLSAQKFTTKTFVNQGQGGEIIAELGA